MKHLLILFVLSLATLSTSAQTIKAITQHGETVVLYENGTWKYEKDLQNEPVSPNVAAAVVPVAPTAPATIVIDNSKELTSDKTDLFNAVSKKLARFFGEEKGRVHCAVSASNTKGEVCLNFEFMVPVGDANRYFGYTSADRPVSITLADGTVISSTFTKNIEEKFIEKWNVSYYKASIVLSSEDVNKLIWSDAIRVTVDWKKIEEEYNIEHTKALKNILSEVI